jgi:iron complex transport system substrate-binding protein
MDENEISKQVVDASLKVHKALGPGLLESVYEAVLAHELTVRGFEVIRQAPIGIRYEGLAFEDAFRADIVVNGKVVVEVKSVEKLASVHGKQVLTYLRLGGFKLGLLVNFGAAYIRDGIERVINGHI